MSGEGTEQSENLPPGLSSPSRARVGRPTKLSPELQAKVIALISAGMFMNEACAEVGISAKTLSSWRKRGANGEEQYEEFFEELEMALRKAEGRMQIIHAALATGRPVPSEMNVNLDAVSLHALHFRLERGGNRPFADLKKLELTGKDGERLSGTEVTPAAAAALIRAEFGDQARQALKSEEGEQEPTGG
jgi:hypothetical protein